jgi:hypothetical protein
VITRGVQTFLMTDVEGSTRLWEANRDSMTSPEPCASSQAIKSKYGVTGLINVTFSLDRLGDLKIAMGPDEMAAIESEAAGLDPPKLVERIARLIA